MLGCDWLRVIGCHSLKTINDAEPMTAKPNDAKPMTQLWRVGRDVVAENVPEVGEKVVRERKLAQNGNGQQ